jgi:hypothetical protein
MPGGFGVPPAPPISSTSGKRRRREPGWIRGLNVIGPVVVYEGDTDRQGNMWTESKRGPSKAS